MTILSFPCFKIQGLTRIDANTMDVKGCKIYLDLDSNGKCDLVWTEGDFRITDATGLSTPGKVGAQVKIRVQAVITAAPWGAAAAPETVISSSIGQAFAVSNLAQVTDPDSASTNFDPGTAH